MRGRPVVPGGWQVVVFAPAGTIPFVLPRGYRWVPNGRVLHQGRSKATMLVNCSSQGRAQSLAQLAVEHGFHGFLHPRFQRSVTTHSGPKGEKLGHATRRRPGRLTSQPRPAGGPRRAAIAPRPERGVDA